MKFDIVIPHLNYPHLRKSLLKLRQNTPSENLGKVILIDQNEKMPQVEDLIDIHVRLPSQGFSKACNIGIRLSDAEFVGCMNDDVEIMHPKWVQGIEETFRRYGNALCVNPGSPRNPAFSGGPAVNAPGFDYKENWTEEEYDKMVNEIGKGAILDGICMFFVIFRREILDKLPGIIPGKAWFDEDYKFSGGQDYQMDRTAYMSGYRCLGTGLSYVFHWWGETVRLDGKTGVKYDHTFIRKNGLFDEQGNLLEGPDIYGKKGSKDIPPVVLRNYN